MYSWLLLKENIKMIVNWTFQYKQMPIYDFKFSVFGSKGAFQDSRFISSDSC